jgi:hypothetical protein
MVDFNRINPAILRQAEALAAERNQTLDVLIEEALRSYLNRRLEGIGGGGTVALPVARHLAGPKVDLSQSLGKLLDVDDDGLPVDKLR